MNARKERSKAIMEMPYHFSQSAQDQFKVRSQFTPDKYYEVKGTPDKGLVCNCPDHQTRKADCKHIKVVLAKLMANKGFANTPFRIMERENFSLCKHCSTGNIKKDGIRKTKNGQTQRFKCLDCGKRFGLNCGFERKHFDPKIITHALELYFRGMSVRDIADAFEKMGTDVNHMTVYNWVSSYSRMVGKYLNEVVPRTKSRIMVRADEVWIKVKGHQWYLFASMDDDSRYWYGSDLADNKFQHNADELLRRTLKNIGGRIPSHFKTDGLPAYGKSCKRVFGSKTIHHAHVHLKGDKNNNKMERLNGEIRDREKVFRGLKDPKTAILDGMKAYYNYSKKHSGLGGKTPAEAGLIMVDGKDKWHTLIQNAALYKISE